MDKSTILVKTAKGADELKARTHALPQKLRAILIMIDGTATAGALLARFGGLPEIETALATLLAQGFVELKGGHPAVPAAKADAAASAVPNPLAGQATEPQTREQAFFALTRFLNDNLGPDGERVVGDLERAKTRVEFLAALESCADMVGAIRGKAKAAIFRERAKAYADTYLGA
jgi:hypothetical protein